MGRAQTIWIYGLMILALPIGAGAVSLEDQFQGFSRAAHMDSLAPRDGDDPFSVAFNPATSSAENIFASAVTRLDWKEPSGLNVKGTSSSTILAATFNYRVPHSQVGLFMISTVPIDRQAILDTGEPSESRFVWNHFAREISYLVGGAWTSESKRHSFGLSLPVFFNARATAALALDPADADARAQVFMAPSISYRLGYLYRFNRNNLSIVYRERQKAEAQIYFQSELPLLSTSYEIEGVSNYLVAPRRVEVSLSRQVLETWEFGARLSWIQWSKVSSPFIKIVESTPTLVSQVTPLKGQDRVFVSAGARHQNSSLQSWTFGAGFRPGIYKSTTPLYSPNEWILGAAYHRSIPSLEWETHVGLRVHLLNKGSFYTWLSLGLGFHL